MKYYAMVYTGSLTPGEYLTEEQVEKLGEVKIADMVRRGALRAVEDSPKTETPVKKAETAPVKTAKPEETDEEDIGLPELTAEEVAGEAPAEKPKKGGRRKTK